MQDLAEAFQIFAQYSQAEHPTWCEHDRLNVDVDPAAVSDEHKARLAELGFNSTDEDGEGSFYSFRFGSC